MADQKLRPIPLSLLFTIIGLLITLLLAIVAAAWVVYQTISTGDSALKEDLQDVKAQTQLVSTQFQEFRLYQLPDMRTQQQRSMDELGSNIRSMRGRVEALEGRIGVLEKSLRERDLN